MTKHPITIVLGLSTNGLSVIRSLARNGIKVIGIDSHYFLPGYYTRYAKCFIVREDPLKKDSIWNSYLVNTARKFNNSSKKAVLFPTSDRHVIYISKNREILSKDFTFNLPTDEVLNISTNRIKLYKFASQLKIPVPNTFFVKSIPDIVSASAKIGYPCILRSTESHIWRKYFKDKLKIINSHEDAIRIYEQITHYQMEIILQEFIPGSDDQVYDFMCYLNKHSDPLGIFLARKLRQYPIGFGVGSLNIGEYQNDLIESALMLLKNLHYTGMAGIEFKWDARENKFKLIEVNPRTSLQGELAIGSGVNLPLIAYKDMVGVNIKPVLSFTEGIKWFNLELDFYSFIGYFKKNELTLSTWLNSLRGKKTYAHFSLYDPLPAMVSFIKLVYKIVNSFLNAIIKNV